MGDWLKRARNHIVVTVEVVVERLNPNPCHTFQIFTYGKCWIPFVPIRLIKSRQISTNKSTSATEAGWRRDLWCNSFVYFIPQIFQKNYKILKWRENTGLTIFLIISTFCFTLCHPMATTRIYNKLQDTSIYINLSSQNLHSAIAALKQEAKPLTTLNIKGFGDTKKRESKGEARGWRWWWWGGRERRWGVMGIGEMKRQAVVSVKVLFW